MIEKLDTDVYTEKIKGKEYMVLHIDVALVADKLNEVIEAVNKIELLQPSYYGNIKPKSMYFS